MENLKAKWQDILNDVNLKSYENNRAAEKIFDFINSDESLVDMIYSCEEMRPALEAVVVKLANEYSKFDEKEKKEFDLKEKSARYAVGRMVGVCLKPFGYVIPKNDLAQKAFKTEIKRQIEDIAPFASGSYYVKEERGAVLEAIKEIKVVKFVRVIPEDRRVERTLGEKIKIVLNKYYNNPKIRSEGGVNFCTIRINERDTRTITFSEERFYIFETGKTGSDIVSFLMSLKDIDKVESEKILSSERL